MRATALLARRAALGIIRQPQMLIPAILFPLFFLALNAAALSRSVGLPGFPEVDSFVDFMLAATVVQGVLFGAISGGTEMARDIETGFFDRLVGSPIPRLAILVGRLGGAALLGAGQAAVFVGVGLLFGAELKAGPAGFVVVVATAVVLAAAIGGLALAIALRTGSPEAVQGFFPLFFVLLFLSSAFFPRELMEGWFQDVAGVNPVSHLIEGLRALFIDGLSVSATARALGVSTGLGVVTLALASSSLRRRVASS